MVFTSLHLFFHEEMTVYPKRLGLAILYICYKLQLSFLASLDYCSQLRQHHGQIRAKSVNKSCLNTKK